MLRWIDFDFGLNRAAAKAAFSLTLASGCFSSSLDAMPKYMRALIFGASRCGLSACRSPSLRVERRAAPIRSGGLRRFGHKRTAHAITLGSDLFRFVHFSLRVEEGNVAAASFSALRRVTDAISGLSFAISSGFWKLNFEASVKGAWTR